MLPLDKAARSSVGQKYLMAVTGIGLVVFIILHLAGNLTLLAPSGESFNLYAEKLHSFGMFTTVGEIGLALVILVHAVMALALKKNYIDARGQGYRAYQSKGGPTRGNVASRNMIVSGIALLAFMIFHVWQFRFSAEMSAGYATNIHGQEIRDLYKRVVEVFKQPAYVGLYTVVMLMLAAHLRHGFWSAFQSLGAMNPRFTGPVYTVALIFGLLIAVGFISLPTFIYFNA